MDGSILYVRTQGDNVMRPSKLETRLSAKVRCELPFRAIIGTAHVEEWSGGDVVESIEGCRSLEGKSACGVEGVESNTSRKMNFE